MQLDVQKVNEFICKVFNYYNGRINIFNPAVLRIEWAIRHTSATGANTRNPNVVTVFPRVIERHFHEPHWFYYNIILCIIHELYHIDQDISFIRMTREPDYVRSIEAVVEMESYLYIANHQHELAEQFGFEDVIPYNEYYNAVKDSYETGALFVRKNYRTHMRSILKDLLNCEEHVVINNFDNAFTDPNSKISVIINNLMFVLKDGNLCMPVLQLNQILEEQFFQYSLRFAELNFGNVSGEPNHKMLVITTDCSNILGKIII